MSNADRATRTIRGYQRRDHLAGCRMVDPHAKEPFWSLPRIAFLVVVLAVATPFIFPGWFSEPVEQGASR